MADEGKLDQSIREKLARLIAAAEAALADIRPTENGFPRNAHCARSRLRQAIAAAREPRCVRCRDGEKPCVRGNPNQCEWPQALAGRDP